jgi:hypothetical protein
VLPLNIKSAPRFLRKWPSATLDIEPPEAFCQKPRARQRTWPGYGAIPCTARAVTGKFQKQLGNDRQRQEPANMKLARARVPPVCRRSLKCTPRTPALTQALAHILTVWNVVTGQLPKAGILDYDLAYFDDSNLS